MPNEIYAIYLENYSCPSCTSGIKTYFGTLDEIALFIDKLSAAGKHPETVKAFGEYTAGNLKAEHVAAYTRQRLINPAELIDSYSLTLAHTEWEYINVYRCPYNMRFDSAEITARLVKLDGKYFRCVQIDAVNLAYYSEFRTENPWQPFNSGFWGYPAMMSVTKKENDFSVKNRLYIIDKRFDSEAEAVSKFKTEPIDFKGYCQDVFGDG